MSTDEHPRSTSTDSLRPRAPVSQTRASDRHRSPRSWTTVLVPIFCVLLLAGLVGMLYTGRSRGGFGRAPTRAEMRTSACGENLAHVVVVWRSEGGIPAELRHERWADQDGLGCMVPGGAPYVVRDLVRCPVDPTRLAEEPLAACIGPIGPANRWTPPHGDVVLVAYADGEVRRLEWADLGLPIELRDGATAPVVGAESASPVLRVMRLAH